MFFKKFAISKSLDLIEALAFCVKLVNKHSFSFLSEETIPCENLLNYLDSHVTDVMSLQVEVFPSGFVELLISHLASVFPKSILERSVTFPNILFATIDARNAINNITGKTIHWSIYFHIKFGCKGFHILSWDSIWTGHARDVCALLVASLDSSR